MKNMIEIVRQSILSAPTAFRRTHFVPLFCIVIVGAALTHSAATLLPHHARGAGQLDSSEELPPSEQFPFGSTKVVAIGEGVGTHEGKFVEINEYELGVQLTEDGPAVVIHGTLRVIAANGDELLWEFTSVTPGLPEPPFDFDGSAVLVEGTGRFEGATGAVETRGTLFADGSYEYVADGWISSVGSSRRK